MLEWCTREECSERAKKYLGKGVHVKKFRRPKNLVNCNKILLALLYSNNIKLSELSEYLKINIRTAERYVYDKSKPKPERMEKLCSLLNIEEEYLFHVSAYLDVDIPKVEIQGQRAFIRSPEFVRNSKIKFKLLYGLLYVYDISTIELATMLGCNQNMLNKWFNGYYRMSKPYEKKLEDLFKIPGYILLKY